MNGFYKLTTTINNIEYVYFQGLFKDGQKHGLGTYIFNPETQSPHYLISNYEFDKAIDEGIIIFPWKNEIRRSVYLTDLTDIKTICVEDTVQKGRHSYTGDKISDIWTSEF